MAQMTHSSGELPGIQDAKRLRTRGKRMLELATRAYCERHYEFARLLTQLATEVFARAKDAEDSYGPSAIRVDASGRPLRHRS
jgi:HEPN domain-containing protein